MMSLCRPQVVHDHEARAERPAPPAHSDGAAHAPCHSHAASSRGPSPDPNPSSNAPPPRLSFYLDGAHTEESMATCADWFADAVAGPSADASTGCHSGGIPAVHGRAGAGSGGAGGAECPEVQRVLLFNCMPVRPVRLGANWAANDDHVELLGMP